VKEGFYINPMNEEMKRNSSVQGRSGKWTDGGKVENGAQGL
jgi:hypothetical protein